MRRYLSTRTLPRAVHGWGGEIFAATALVGGLAAMLLGY